ncbi:hypothetical protein DYZ35_01141 [Listeria monocytogenes]|nr:hypothetical protein O174_07005 [Listeria monocytogenes serotype 4bV str. LS644]ERH78165.1 hypothetical protein O171_04530 [Listeria monocytogenes serotype 4bV str. LS645]ERH84453.1 hypothetical protein O168_05425 [Listeria monocytogenes serotype 4bV str. LS643]KHK22561.1 hypothetical protein I615_07223 [Listeria monocytogenes SHL007]KHK34678.1 hypothetical protein I621_06931 [Listeria monocytogenes SHL012]QWF91743.1 hypothetical protein KJJ31_00098 [Listeria monocytogenes]
MFLSNARSNIAKFLYIVRAIFSGISVTLAKSAQKTV